MLAQRAGVELKPFRPEFKELTTERTRLYEICNLAASFFEKQLEASSAGKAARDYLLGRGISPDSIKSWRLGYSPETWEGLVNFLVGRGYQQKEIISAGLAIESTKYEVRSTKYEDAEKSSKIQTSDFRPCYDRFRGRIMFPIFDLNSQVIGFGGRVFAKKDEKEIAKYINTPATILYDKSRTLYGLEKAKVEVRKKDACILVEGYTDAIVSHQVGINNAVAVSGTALTPWHLKILRRYTENLDISFDMDVAGDTATKRGIDLALSQGFNVKVITLPEGKDPAELAVKSPEAWLEAVGKTKSILEFYFESTLNKFDKTKVEGKKGISKILLPIIKKIPNRIEQTFWLQNLAKEIGAKEEDLTSEMAKVKLEEEVLGLEPEEIINLPQKTRKELLEERLICLVLKNRANLEKLLPEHFDCLSDWAAKIVAVFQKVEDNDKAFQNLEATDRETLNYLSLKAEILEELSEKDQNIDFSDCLREIKNMETKTRLESLSQEVRTAEQGKDHKKTQELIEKFKELTKKLK
jgi:DNA primase